MHGGGFEKLLGKTINPSDMVSKMSLSIALMIASCAELHFDALFMLALPSRTVTIDAGACFAAAENFAHMGKPASPIAIPPAPELELWELLEFPLPSPPDPPVPGGSSDLALHPVPIPIPTDKLNPNPIPIHCRKRAIPSSLEKKNAVEHIKPALHGGPPTPVVSIKPSQSLPFETYLSTLESVVTRVAQF
jgi:hypothetical protein